MPTRRAFFKTIAGLGAAILPWSVLPNRLEETVKDKLGRPPVKQRVPFDSGQKDSYKFECLHRTAMDDIYVLTGSEMQGRRAGSEGERRASDYLSSQLSMLGLRPMGDGDKGFLQEFLIPPVEELRSKGRLELKLKASSAPGIPCVNLIGGLMGQISHEIIMLSAHYDHLGISRGTLYPGANDNASGVGCVLDVLRQILRDGKPLKRTLVVAFWSASEMTSAGSKAFVQAPSFPLKYLRVVFDVDSVGNGMIGNFAIRAEEENVGVKALRQASPECGASVLLSSEDGHNSDSYSFATASIPAVTIRAQERFRKSHTPDDTVAFIKPEQISKASRIIYKSVQRLAY